MNKVLALVKAHIVAIICGVLVLIAVGWIFMVNSQGNTFIEQIQKRLDREKQIKGYQQQPVSYPAPGKEGGTQSKTTTINRAVIDQLKDVFGKMEREGRAIFEVATRFNAQNQIPMTANLFPDNKDASLRILARRDYTNSFIEMFDAHSSSADLPRLRAKPPITEAEIDIGLKAAEDAYMSSNFMGRDRRDLTLAEQENLRNELQKKRIEILKQYARTLNIYTQSSAGMINSTDYPFQVMSWSTRGTPPTDLELWEGQMQLWIQQDIARVIALTNGVSQKDSDVTKAPIKRLFKMSILGGYIGLGSRGLPSVDGGSTGGGGGELNLSPTQEDFNLSVTGRRSNELYDVRHAKLEVIVDIMHLPEFFDNMVQVNFMTALNMEITDEDEYEAVKRNYYYGLGDCVKLTMELESIWLREWTSKLMPASVKAELGVPITETAR